MALTALPHMPDSPQTQAADVCHLATQLHWYTLDTVIVLPDCDPAQIAAAALAPGHIWAVQHLALTPLTAVVQAQLASASPSRGVDTPPAELGTRHAAPKEMHLPQNLLRKLPGKQLSPAVPDPFYRSLAVDAAVYLAVAGTLQDHTMAAHLLQPTPHSCLHQLPG